MARQASRASNNGGKGSPSFGKGDVTPTQVAFIVDQYLLDKSFNESRSAFRTEASSFLGKAVLNDAPRGLLSLEAILNEYISLKTQKVMVDQERVRLDQEKCRVQNLLQGMQNAMNTYNGSSPSASAPSMIPAVAQKTTVKALTPTESLRSSPSGQVIHKTPMAHPVSTPSSVNTQLVKSTSSLTVCPPRISKRKGLASLSEAPQLAKRSRGKSTAKIVPAKDNSSCKASQATSAVKSSPKETNALPSVAKCLFNQSVPPTTPPRQSSSQGEKSISPLEISSVNNGTPEEGFTTTRCTVISSKRVTVSPFKQMAYSMERNHCFTTTSSPVKRQGSSSKRDHVKGRLDFDGSDASINLDSNPTAPIYHDHDHLSTSESDKDVDLFDIDLPSLDVIGSDLSFTDMLREFDLECEEMGYSYLGTMDASSDDALGSSPESNEGNLEADQLVEEYSSTVTEVLSQKDITAQGQDSMTAVQSVTRCIKIISPVKNHGSPAQNCSPTS